MDFFGSIFSSGKQSSSNCKNIITETFGISQLFRTYTATHVVRKFHKLGESIIIKGYFTYMHAFQDFIVFLFVNNISAHL